MLEYYTNQKAGIFFDDNPHVCIRYIPSMTEEERKSIEKYPFINKKNLQVRLCDYQKDKTYNFGIPKGYCYDGASIPRLFWRVIGSNTDNRFLNPLGRFPTIEEDEAPYRLLCNEYPPAKD